MGSGYSVVHLFRSHSSFVLQMLPLVVPGELHAASSAVPPKLSYTQIEGPQIIGFEHTSVDRR